MAKPTELQKRVWDWIEAALGPDIDNIIYGHQRGDVPSLPFVMIQEGDEIQRWHETISYTANPDDPETILKEIITEHETNMIVSIYDEEGRHKDMLRTLTKSHHNVDIALLLSDNSLVVRGHGPLLSLYESLDTRDLPKAVTTFRIAYRHIQETEELWIKEIEATGQEDLDGLTLIKNL